MLHAPSLGYTHFTPASFAGKPGVYVMRITLKDGTFTKIGETEGGQTNRTATWGEHQQVIRFLGLEDDWTREFIESEIRKALKHDGYQPLILDGTQSEDWFAEEALGSAIRAIEECSG